jgi:hypothetical protein
LEVAKTESLPVEEFHFSVEALGDSVVAGEPPHGGDLLRPGSQGLAELNELCESGLTQFIDGAEQPRHQDLTLLAGTVLFQQQVPGLDRRKITEIAQFTPSRWAAARI